MASRKRQTYQNEDKYLYSTIGAFTGVAGVRTPKIFAGWGSGGTGSVRVYFSEILRRECSLLAERHHTATYLPA